MTEGRAEDSQSVAGGERRAAAEDVQETQAATLMKLLLVPPSLSASFVA